jgi:hypothetical protein
MKLLLTTFCRVFNATETIVVFADSKGCLRVRPLLTGLQRKEVGKQLNRQVSCFHVGVQQQDSSFKFLKSPSTSERVPKGFILIHTGQCF